MKSPAYLNALRAFEASARHQSFSEAAKELNVTPAAVGQLVRNLEQIFDVELFIREKNGKNRLITTPLADTMLPDVRLGFKHINLGLEKIKEPSLDKTIRVTISPSFAEKWLIPRLDHFQNAYPDIDIELQMKRELSNFLSERIDIGIRYGHGNWEGLNSIKFLEEDIFPVCSVSFLEKHNIEIPQDLMGKMLIHDLSVANQQDFFNWKKWSSSIGVKNINTARGMKINNSAAVIQAAIDGYGVALTRSVMVDDDLKAKRLIRLFPEITFKSNMAYYIVYCKESFNDHARLAFKSWLLNEVK